MRQGKQTPESIQAQYEAFELEWNAQRNATADRIKIDRPDSPSRTRSRIESIYDWIAGNDDYQRNDNNRRLIQSCVITVVMIS